MAATAPIANACIPIKVDAFILNQSVVDNKIARIAPITQPNYTFLRLDNSVIQNGVLDHTDLRYTSPSALNSRITDFGTKKLRQNRIGVYVSWILPRVYRAGSAATASSGDQNATRKQQGYQPVQGTADYSAPDFRSVPTRWLVVCYIDTSTIVPASASSDAAKLQLHAWVIDSDLKPNIVNLPESTDLQVDVSPFVSPSRINSTDTIAQQAEAFIGGKKGLKNWTGWTESPSPFSMRLTTFLQISSYTIPMYSAWSTTCRILMAKVLHNISLRLPQATTLFDSMRAPKRTYFTCNRTRHGPRGTTRCAGNGIEGLHDHRRR